jgi:hypothetical protein
MADLTIVVDVRNNQTMSSYRVPKSDKVVFVNASTTDALVISPKDDGVDPPETLPFCESDKTTPIPMPLTVAASGSGHVHICKNWNGTEFLYTAQTGTAAAEDPIVIIEKPKLNFYTPEVAFLLGAAVAAVITYFIVKSRSGRTRPQQG